MATIHKENGRYHLHMELKDISEEDKNATQEKAPSSQKMNENISTHIVQEFDFQFTNDCFSSQTHASSQEDVVAVFIKINSPPPKS